MTIPDINSRACVLGVNPTVEASYLLNTEQLFKEVGHNTGNLAFLHAINRQTGVERYFRKHAIEHEYINENFDVGILPCANQIGQHADQKHSVAGLRKGGFKYQVQRLSD